MVDVTFLNLFQNEDGGPKQREEWMIQLPEKKLSLGLNLTARTFRSGSGAPAADDDGSAWTATPADKEQKLQVCSRGI